MKTRDILEVVRFEGRTNEVKVGFRYDHIAFAVFELYMENKLRLPHEAVSLEPS
jgi:hypothetical protein